MMQVNRKDITLKLLFSVLFLSFILNGLLAYTERPIIRTDAAPNQAFGFSVSLNNNRSLIGAYGDFDPTHQSVNGSVYFNQWNGTNWEQIQKLYCPIPDFPEGLSEIGFGYKVLVRDTVAFISAPWDYTGFNVTGAVYYYHFNGSQWIFRQKIAPSIEGGLDDFGTSLDFDGSKLAVGAPGSDLVVDTNVPTQMNYGSVYVFKWNGSQWIEEQVFRGTDTNCFDSFGDRVSIKGNTIIAGAYAAGPFNPGDIHQEGTGKVYVFNYNGTQWVQSQILAPTDGSNGNWFGRSVKLTNDYIAVGSPFNSMTAGIRGALYIYKMVNNQWTFSQKLLPTANDNSSIYGTSVDILGDRMAVGAAYWTYANNGSVYVYNLNNEQWVQNHVLNHSDPSESGDDFGYSLSISGDRILVGAPWKDGWAGGAYVYHYDNMLPIANAGADQTVQQNILVTLNGTQSSDPENSPLTYQWVSLNGITLSSNTVASPTFTSPAVTQAYMDYFFTLTVNDGTNNSTPDTVKVRVLNSNLMPVANAGSDQSALENTVCILNGSLSFDPEGSAITYFWTAPQGLSLSNSQTASPSFTCPEVSQNTVLTFSLIVNDGQFDSEPSFVEITVMPVLPVQNLIQETGTLHFTWNPPASSEKVFRYDDNTATNALGANNETAMLGVAFYENSIIDQVSWLLSDQTGAHSTVNIYILGLNAEGQPDQSQILGEFINVANTDNQWNSFEPDNEIIAPNGFYLGLNYAGYLGLSIDDGIGAPYAFQNGTHWASVDWTAGSWTSMEELGFPNNFLLRAHGLSIASAKKTVMPKKIKAVQNSDFILTTLNTPINSNDQNRNEFFLNQYNLYLDGNLIAQNYESRDYTIAYLPIGNHTFGVKALYQGDVESDIVQIAFTGGTGTDDLTAVEKTYLTNYPNPFNPNTTIHFNLKEDTKVELEIYNIKGQKVITLLNQHLKSGKHSYTWNGLNQNHQKQASGMYFCKLKTNHDTRINKMVLMK